MQQSFIAMDEREAQKVKNRQSAVAKAARQEPTRKKSTRTPGRRAAQDTQKGPVRGLMSIDTGFRPHVPGIRYGVLDQLMGYAVRRAELCIYTDLLPSLQPWGMTPQRFSSLSVIAYNPGVRMSDLAHVIGVAPSGAAIIVQVLERLGYVSRNGSASDGRVSELHVTPAGMKALREIEAAALACDRRATRTLTATERKELLRLLEKFGQ